MTQKEALQKVSEKKVKIGDLAPNLGSGEMGKWPQCGEMGKKREFWLGKEIKTKSGQKDPKKKPGKKWGRKAENWEIGDKSGTSRNGEMKGKWDLRGEPQKWGFLCSGIG